MSEKKSKIIPIGCLVIFAMIILAILGISAFVAAIGTISQDQGLLSQRHVQGSLEGPGIAILSASGVMMRDEEGVGGEGITNYLLTTLSKVRKDPSIKGVMIKLNTPGGAVTDAD